MGKVLHNVSRLRFEKRPRKGITARQALQPLLLATQNCKPDVHFTGVSFVEGLIENAHAGSRTRVTSMGGLYDAATLRARVRAVSGLSTRYPVN